MHCYKPWGKTCTSPVPSDEATPCHCSLKGSSTTTGLGSCIPSAHLLSSQRCPSLLPWHLLTASPCSMHSSGEQAGQQILAGRKTRAINYLLPLLLKISFQGNDPKEKSKYNCIHDSSASNFQTLGKSQQWKLQTKAHMTLPGHRMCGPGELRMQPELQLWALKDPGTELRDSRKHCLGHWVCAEGNLKTFQLSFPR